MEMFDGHVMTCHADDCSYNCELECCAPGIRVGDSHPTCDTYTHSTVAAMNHDAAVSTCGVVECHFNDNSSCEAGGITLMHHSSHVDCSTYRTDH